MFVYLAEYHSPLPKRQALVSYRFTISLKFATRIATKKFTLQTTDVVLYIVMFVDLAEHPPPSSQEASTGELPFYDLTQVCYSYTKKFTLQTTDVVRYIVYVR